MERQARLGHGMSSAVALVLQMQRKPVNVFSSGIICQVVKSKERWEDSRHELTLRRRGCHRVNFPTFMSFIYPEDTLQLALCTETKTPKGNPKSFWPEGVEDIIQKNCRYWKVREEF